MSALKTLLNPARLTEVVDIGANPIDGDPPYKPMLESGLCRVTGFEPQEQALAELQRKKGPFERYLPYAVGDGEVHTLNICRASGMTSLFEPDPATLDLFQVLKPLGEVVRQVEVPTRKLNDVSEIEHLDFLKIDIQGGELAVFKSGGGGEACPDGSDPDRGVVHALVQRATHFGRHRCRVAQPGLRATLLCGHQKVADCSLRDQQQSAPGAESAAGSRPRVRAGFLATRRHERRTVEASRADCPPLLPVHRPHLAMRDAAGAARGVGAGFAAGVFDELGAEVTNPGGQA